MDSRRLDEKLAPAMEEEEIAQAWRRVKEARREAPARRRARMAIGIGAAVAATAAVVAIVLATGGGARTAGGGERSVAEGDRATGGGETATGAGSGDRVAVTGPIASADLALEAGVRLKPAAERTIAMNDGSVVALAAASELEVLANESDKFVTAVRRGWARFDVKPGGARRWVVETDLATVEVVGTAFVVERSDEQLVVEVEHGVVLVRGERVPGRVVRLTAGEVLEVPARVASAPGRPERSASFDSSSPSTRSARSGSDSLRTNEPAPAVVAAVDVAEAAIARADALLAKGKAIDAADELERFLDDAGDDAGAGLAAFLLGRIAQDQLGDPERAAAAFARTLAIGSPRAVQDEASARRARALAAAGRAE